MLRPVSEEPVMTELLEPLQEIGDLSVSSAADLLDSHVYAVYTWVHVIYNAYLKHSPESQIRHFTWLPAGQVYQI